MLLTACTLAASGLLFGQPPTPRSAACGRIRWNEAPPTVEPYFPHEGDILFYDDQNKLWTFLFWLGGTKPPFHVGIVVKRPDGSWAVLEAGADDQTWVWVLDLVPRLHDFEGIIQVRRCKVALTPEQSQRLTAFALAQHGKPYAVMRLALQLTPLRSRGYLHQRFYAGTYLDRNRWVCVEIVVAAGTLVGLFDPAVVKATAVYPLDLLDDHVYDLSPVYEGARYWSPGP